MATKPQSQEWYQVLPKPLLRSERFLVWREKPDPVTGRKRKVPFYANGEPRNGRLESEGDLSHLVGLDEAVHALSGGFTGIGLALVEGDGIGAFDLDYCLNEKGELIPEHPGYTLALNAEALGSYIEVSPSGRGLRILGPCTETQPFSEGGLEYWGARRFVTLTARVWANPGGWYPLDAFRSRIGRLRADYGGSRSEGEGVILTPRLVDDLRAALAVINSDDRELWIRMGHALKGLGHKGKLLWLEWSKTSRKFHEGDANRVWDSFVPMQISHKSVFFEAQEHWGWKNPKTRNQQSDENDEEDDEEGFDPGPPYRVELGDFHAWPDEYVLDGFFPIGVSVIAGAWGAGKSTNLIPLLSSVAHLTPEEWGFRSNLRRKILWVSEAPEQARTTLYSMAKTGGSASWKEMNEWFHLHQSKRRPIQKLIKYLKRHTKPLIYELENGFPVYPLIVLDTASANVEMANESDNSEVAGVMNNLKQHFIGYPIIVVGHTPKALTKKDVGDLTFRGAGAWEADAVATYFLVHDEDTDQRFMAIRKRRFAPDYQEVLFDTAGGSEIVETPWGIPQTKRYNHGIPQKTDGFERKEIQEQRRQEQRESRHEQTLSARQGQILSMVTQAASEQQPLTRKAVFERVGGKKELCYEAVNRLIEGELLKEIPAPHPEGRGRPSSYLIPVEMDEEYIMGKTEEKTGD